MPENREGKTKECHRKDGKNVSSACTYGYRDNDDEEKSRRKQTLEED